MTKPNYIVSSKWGLLEYKGNGYGKAVKARDIIRQAARRAKYRAVADAAWGE